MTITAVNTHLYFAKRQQKTIKAKNKKTKEQNSCKALS